MTKPYEYGDGAITTNAIDWETYLVEEEVYERDVIDVLVYDMARDDELDEIVISPEVWSAW